MFRIRPLSALLAAVLAALTLAVYAPVVGFEFVSFDDDVFVYENPRVNAGLTWDNVAWALTSFSSSYWVPLAQLSHMLDVRVFGLNAGGHHLTNLLLHVIASLVLFAALKRMTGAPVRSFAASAVFALHPLHVESVAWVAERRDVLCGLFWMLTLWAYAGYARRPTAGRYAAVVALVALALMAKPLAVTLPIVLLLLDVWPLSRPSSLRALVLEKTPMLGLAAVSGMLTYAGQSQGGAVLSLAECPLGLRVLNVPRSILVYIVKAVIPGGLSAFYPFPASIPLWQGAGAALVLVALSAGAVVAARRRPALYVGWLWYLITLLPVIGIVQVGVHARADRATYLPLVGLAIIVSWGAGGRAKRSAFVRAALACGAIAALLGYAAVARAQVLTWRNSLALFTHALDVNPGNWLAENGVGAELLRQGRVEEAVPHFRRALALRPTFVRAWNNLGVAYHRLGRFEEAMRQYEGALRADPRTPTALYNLGLALEATGRDREAVEKYRAALVVDPDYVDARAALARHLLREGAAREARVHLRRAVELRPRNDAYRAALAWAWLREGRPQEAAVEAREALKLNPANDAARGYLSYALEALKNRP